MNRAVYIDEIWERLSNLDPNMLIQVQDIKNALQDAPDVDVPCISCKNCAYRTVHDSVLYCNYWRDTITEETYCAEGILREDK